MYYVAVSLFSCRLQVHRIQKFFRVSGAGKIENFVIKLLDLNHYYSLMLPSSAVQPANLLELSLHSHSAITNCISNQTLNPAKRHCHFQNVALWMQNSVLKSRFNAATFIFIFHLFGPVSQPTAVIPHAFLSISVPIPITFQAVLFSTPAEECVSGTTFL